MGYDGCDAGAAGEKHDGVEGGEVAGHATVWAVEEGAVGFVGAFLDGCVEDFAREATKRAEDKGHVSILLAVVGGKVFAAKGGDCERMILEDGDAGHAQIDVLSRFPADFGGDGDFDGVFGQYSDSGLFSNEPRDAPGMCPIEVEKTNAVRKEPDGKSGE